MNKNTDKKTRCTKRVRHYYRYTAKEVAELAKASESYVKQLRLGVVNTNTHKAQQVLAIDELLYDGSNRLLAEVDRILNQPTKN